MGKTFIWRYLGPALTSGLLAFPLFAAETATTRDQVVAKINQYNRLIRMEPNYSSLYIERGKLHFTVQDFDRAIADFSQAIKLNPRLDEAYFERGMALGRAGRVEEGIADLTEFIKRQPNNSVAYTKRGVRHIWINKLDAAEHDLKRAVELDPSNAEAHDDLGVVLAKRGKVRQAAEHFSICIRLDPGYQKAYHNLSMAHFMMGDNARALAAIDAGLALDAEHRGSLLMKAVVLEAVGRGAEAEQLRQKAEFLPEDNWTERFGVK